MEFCLHHSLALSAGVFVNAVDTTPDILVWGLDRDRGLLGNDVQSRLRGHEGQVQRSVSCFALVPRSTDRPMLLVAGMLETAGLDIFARVEKRVHEELIKAEFCPYLQRLVTVSARRVTIWDAKSGEALTTLTSERLLGNDQADITAFASDHQVWCVFSIGGDGELHVLDAADEKGYIKPPPPSAGRRCKRLQPPLAARGDTSSRDNAVNHAEDDHDAIGNSDDDLSAGQLRSRRGASRLAKQSNFQPNGGGRSEEIGTGGLTANPASLGIRKCGAPRAAKVGACAGAEVGKANRKGGRSVLLRQVVFASNDSEDPSDVGHSSVDEDKNADAARPDRREARSPPQQEEKELLGTAEESSRESGMLNHRVCPAEDALASTGTAAPSMKSRWAIHRPFNCGSASTRVGRASSSLHLWDAERMSLLGTLLVPCLALTRDLTNAAAAFSVHRRCAAVAQPPVDPSATDSSSTPVESSHGNNKDMGGDNPTATVGKKTTTTTSQPPVRHTAAATEKQHAASKTGTGLNRPALVTALMFLSPYPLLMGASTEGAVVVWRTLDCVCVQGKVRHSRNGVSILSINIHPFVRTRYTFLSRADENTPHARPLVVFAMSFVHRWPPTETTLIYVGNGNGDIVAAHLSPTELAELSGPAKGPVPCQRRPNHNPYRAVRVELTPQVARFSLQAACRVQKQAAAGGNGEAGVAGGVHADMPRRRQKGSSSDGVGPNNFAVPSSGFHSAWVAHSGAVTSISWIKSPPSLLSSSADGLAKIWKPDGSAMLGQASLRFASLLNDVCARPVPWMLYRGSHRHGSNNQTWHVAPALVRSASTPSLSHLAALADGHRRMFHAIFTSSQKSGTLINWGATSSGFDQQRSKATPPLEGFNSMTLDRISSPPCHVMQLDINDRRPERAMYLAAEASRHWAFVPGSGGPADCRHEKDDLDQEKVTHDTAKATTATTDCVVKETIGNSEELTVNDTTSNTKTDSFRGGDGNLEGDLHDDVGVEADSTGAGPGWNERRGRSGRQQQQQHDMDKQRDRDEKTHPDGGGLRSPDPTRGSSKHDNSDINNSNRARTWRSCDDHEWQRPYRCRCDNQEETDMQSNIEVNQLFGRQDQKLQDFEEALEASSSKRTPKAERFHLGRPMSLASMQPIRKTPLCGKRWRTKSAPWTAEDESLLERSMSEQGLPTAGSVRVGTHKGMRGYVRPTVGSAEDAALKRTKSRGATGVVLKGRPLREWLAQPEGECVVPCIAGTGEPANAVARGAGESPMDKTIKGLPPVAVLAGSHGGRLIASGITIAGDRGGGGFNVKAARAAARTATRRAALAEELAKEGERNRRKRNKADKRARTTIGTGASRQQRQGTQNGRTLHGGRGPSSWGIGQGDDCKSSRRAILDNDGDGIGAAGETSPGGVPNNGGGSLAPSFGGMTQSVGSVGSVGGGSIVGTEASESTVALPAEGAADTRKLRELNEDSVVWVSTRRGSGRSSASSKNRRQRQNQKEGSGQVETIRRLVHMGLF
ncbi:unnamed protein product [Ectocarpus sp. CCAP 1310/34]|nr:unnamed protein product [Ectocarpus sp. CCAP 1310/34]